MPYSDNPWGWDDTEFEEQVWEADPFGDESFSIWKPHDPDPWFSPSMDERRAYRDAAGLLAARLSRENLGGRATAFGPSGYGAAYQPPFLRWSEWDGYEPKSKVAFGVWGHDHGLDDPFPILGGAILSPTVDIFTKPRAQQFDDNGRPLNAAEYRVSSALTSGRATMGEIMRLSGDAGRDTLRQLQAAGAPLEEARAQAERAARAAVRSMTASFGRADFGERWSWPYALREAVKGSANIRLHGDYGVGPRDLFAQLGPLGYFTRATSPSSDPFHPERGAWQATSLDSLYALGWLRSPDGGFITGTSKPVKRRQLGVQRLAAPVGAEALMTTGRLTGDRLLTTTAVFLNNYPFSEGSGVVDPGLLESFREYRPRSIERPTRAGEDWQVRFTTVGQQFGPGEDVFLGEQFVGGKWQPLERLPGVAGVSQRVFGHRETVSGYQALVERDFPFESGTAKLMHYGMKALLFQSGDIIGRMQEQVRLAQAAGVLPADVAAPRLVLPMSKDWMQTYFGMFDVLPEETLRAMGISAKTIASRDWQEAGPEAISRLHEYVQQRRFTFAQQHEVPVSRLGAFLNVDNAADISYFEKGGERFARFTATHTGYAIPIAAGFRMEYPGKSPMYSPEELMQLMQHYPQVAGRLLQRGNAAARIWGVAAASTAGVVPGGAVSHEDLPWVSARLNLEGNFDDEGTARSLIGNLARELDARGLGRSAIVGPGGSLLPAPSDVLGKSVLGLSGQEQSQFVSSYVSAMKLLATGEDAGEALGAFSERLQIFASGHNVRREALGARLHNAIEGTFTSHMAIPDDVVVVGSDHLRTLAGIHADDAYAADKLAAFAQQLEREPFYALGTRRPVSDMFNQLGVPLRVATEEMARRLWDVPIENLGRSYAVSATTAAIWRGDVDADRALIHAVTRAAFKGTEVHTSAGAQMWYAGGVSFQTSDDVLESVRSQTLMQRQIGALRTHAPAAYASYLGGLTRDDRAALETGLAGGADDRSLLALSRALHGVDVDWNESAKWSQELRAGVTKNDPHDLAWYADPANRTVFGREQMTAAFEANAKSKMLMGRGYNRYIRGLTALAETPEELQAAVTMAANIYQKALDNQQMTRGELMLFNVMESLGASGAMYDKFHREEGYISSAFAGGPAGMLGMLADFITDIDVPAEARGLLFSRDPRVAEAVQTGRARQIIQAVGSEGGEVAGARAFLQDPARAGILTQLVQALHYSKQSMADVNLNQAEQAYAVQGQRLRSTIRVQGRAQEGGLPLGPYLDKDARGNPVAMPGAIGDIRNMAGLSTLAEWQRGMAARMGLPEAFFSSDDDVRRMLREMGVPDFDNPQTANNDEHLLAIVNLSEAELMQHLRRYPKSQWPEIMAAWRERQGPSAPAQRSTVPPGGDASVAHQVFEEMGGREAFGRAVEDIRAFKTNRQPGDPLIPAYRLPRQAVNEVIARGGGEAAMQEWSRIMGEFGVGFQHQIEQGPTGPTPVWSHIYGRQRVSRAAPFAMPELTAEQYGQLEQMVGGLLQGAMPDPNTFLGGLATSFNAAMQGQGELDLSAAAGLVPLMTRVMASGGYGDQFEVFLRQYSPNSLMARLKVLPAGLQGHARDLLYELAERTNAEGYTPEVMQLMEQGFAHRGIGQELTRHLRRVADTDLPTATLNEAWSMWESVQKVVGGLGGTDLPEAFVGRVETLGATMSQLLAGSAAEAPVDEDAARAFWLDAVRRTVTGRGPLPPADLRRIAVEQNQSAAWRLLEHGVEATPGQMRAMTPAQRARYHGQRGRNVMEWMGRFDEEAGPEFDAALAASRSGYVTAQQEAWQEPVEKDRQTRAGRAYWLEQAQAAVTGGAVPQEAINRIAEEQSPAAARRLMDYGVEASGEQLGAMTPQQRARYYAQRGRSVLDWIGQFGQEAGPEFHTALAATHSDYMTAQQGAWDENISRQEQQAERARVEAARQGNLQFVGARLGAGHLSAMDIGAVAGGPAAVSPTNLRRAMAARHQGKMAGVPGLTTNQRRQARQGQVSALLGLQAGGLDLGAAGLSGTLDEALADQFDLEGALASEATEAGSDASIVQTALSEGLVAALGRDHGASFSAIDTLAGIRGGARGVGLITNLLARAGHDQQYVATPAERVKLHQGTLSTLMSAREQLGPAFPLEGMAALNETVVRLGASFREMNEQVGRTSQVYADHRRNLAVSAGTALYPATESLRAGIAEAEAAMAGGQPLSEQQRARLQRAQRYFKTLSGGGLAFDEELAGAEHALLSDSLVQLAREELGVQQPAQQPGLRGAVGRLFGRGPDGDGAPAIENMFTELTLGWTAFRARMAWNLATGAQRGWMEDFTREETAAVGAALAGGAQPGTTGAASRYIATQAALANTRAQLGEGVAQVYTPLMSAVSGIGAAPALGAAATLLGAPVGLGAVSAMGVQMVGRGIESAALTGLAGPVGLAMAAGTGAVLGTSYLTGLGESWAQQPADSPEYRAGRALRPAQIWAEQAGLPAWAGTLVGGGVASLTGLYRLGALGRVDLAPRDVYSALMPDEVMRQFAQEGSAAQPGTLVGDIKGLRAWASDRYHSEALVENVLQLAGSMFQVTGRSARDVYEGRAPGFEALMDTYVQYMESGASPGELVSSQLTASAAAGIPLGGQTETWMQQFTTRIPAEQRKMYEQAFAALSPLTVGRGTPTSFDEAAAVVGLVPQYGTVERAATAYSGGEGYGWFTSLFGVMPGGDVAKGMGGQIGLLSQPTQDAVQRMSGQMSQSMIRAGMTPQESLGLITSLAGTGSADNTIGLSNLVVQAESVALQTGQPLADILLPAWGAGMEGASTAQQRWFLATQAGVGGLAPGALVPGQARARAFEGALSGVAPDAYDEISLASSMLNRIRPSGFSGSDLGRVVGALLADQLTLPEITLGEQALAGKAGLAGALGIAPGSPPARVLEQTIMAGPGSPLLQAVGVDTSNLPPRLNEDQRAAMAQMLNPSYFRHMTGYQIAGVATPLTDAFLQVWNGELSAAQYDQMQQVASGATPWGWSAQLGFGPGSLTDSLGRPYGQYEPWVASAGRQAGRSFAPLFDLQMGAGYAGMAYTAGASAIQHRQFQMQQAQLHQEWGGGPLRSLKEVQAALFRPEGASSINLTGQPDDEVPVSGDVGSLQVGGSTVGLAQQEAAIRRQMWQENLAYQQQSIQFQRQSLEISKQELALSRQTYTVQREQRIEEREAGRGWQLRQRGWSAEDFAIQVQRTGITQQWQMEDLQRARRYSFGRQRADIDRQIERLEITQGWERGDQNRQRGRELEAQRYQDQRYEAAVRFEQQLHDLQMQRFALQEQRLALQEQMLAAQEAHLNNQAALQAKLHAIEDERFKTQYEQTQQQLKDNETLEKLRQAKVAAELAYESARLANLETIRDSEQKFTQHLKGVKEGGVLDKWIEFFNAVRAGPPNESTPPPPNETTPPVEVPAPTGGGAPRSFASVQRGIPAQEMRIDSALPAAQPVVVNFVLDGETVMQAVVKPERLRPVVQEIARRERYR